MEESKPKPKLAQIFLFPVPDYEAQELDRITDALEDTPDDVLLTYITQRFSQKQVIKAFNS